MSLFRELHRRNVIRVGIAYTVTSWLVLQVADVVMESIGAPDWVMQALLFVLVIGLLLAFFFRSFVGVIAPLIVVQMGVFSCLAFIAAIGWSVNMSFGSMPSLLTAIGVARVFPYTG